MSLESVQSSVLDQLKSWPACGTLQVAFSGGLDSTCLLLALAGLRSQLSASLTAAHVNHHLLPASGEWENHCRKVCAESGIELAVLHVEAAPVPGESPEAWARDERYRLLGAQLPAGGMLLTAHTRDDQAETLLLQLSRGAGPAGLAAMPSLRKWGDGWHGRPLLGVDRAVLKACAESSGWTWVDDISNEDRRFDRNFIRHEVLAKLRTRWPSINATLARAAALQAQSLQVLGESAMEDLAGCLETAGVLNLRRFRELSPPRQAALLRRWARLQELPLPDSRDVARILDEVLNARMRNSPLVAWQGAELRRYRDRLYLSAPMTTVEAGSQFRWKLAEPGRFAGGELLARAGSGIGLKMSALPEAEVLVCLRQGGERVRPAGSRHRRELKTLLQEHGIPPWLRDRIPLLYVGKELAAVAGLCVAAEFAAAPGEPSWEINWQPA